MRYWYKQSYFHLFQICLDKHQLNLQDKLNEIQKDMDDWFVEMDKAIYGAPNELTEDLIQVNGEMS